MREDSRSHIAGKKRPARMNRQEWGRKKHDATWKKQIELAMCLDTEALSLWKEAGLSVKPNKKTGRHAPRTPRKVKPAVLRANKAKTTDLLSKAGLVFQWGRRPQGMPAPPAD